MQKKFLSYPKNDTLQTILPIFFLFRFPYSEDKNYTILDYHIIDVTEDGEIMVVANHGPVLSNLYTSAKITPYEVQFSLSLERVMFYNPNVTWHDSWLAATAGMCIEKKSTQDLNFSLGIQTKAKL